MADSADQTLLTEKELQASARVFLAEVDRLREIESRKGALPPGDDARPPLARQVEDVVVGLVAMSRYQTRLVDTQTEALDGYDNPVRSVPEVLEDWRAAERRLHEARTAMERAADETARLREEHHRTARRSDD